MRITARQTVPRTYSTRKAAIQRKRIPVTYSGCNRFQTTSTKAIA
ncbi:hypothetical protein SS05631_c29050 [Sinorhizobium sp. CCBAU 05631]|nr:hypothetical protein SS05631_c29050 [Sinorhizobium sp. CCBAU 05631]